jgi:hypothetical protein
VLSCFQDIDVFSPGKRCAAVGLCGNSVDHRKEGWTEVIIIIIIIIIIIMYDYTSYNWSHWNSNEKLKEKSGSGTGKTFDRFTAKDSYTWNITHNTESTAV